MSTKSIPHGTGSGYSYHKCHCPECTNAKRLETMKWRENNKERYAQTRRDWIRRNRGLFRKYSNEYYHNLQDSIPGNPERQGKRWTEEEINLAARKTLTSSEVAIELGRTYSSVRNKRAELRDKLYWS